MLRSIFLLACCLYALYAQAQPDPQRVISSEIEAVTVYQRQARIERIAKTNVAQGTQTIILEKLTPNIVQNSIQVTIKNRNVDLVSALSRTRMIAETQSARDSIKIAKRTAVINDSSQILRHAMEDIQLELNAVTAARQVVTSHDPLGSAEDKGYTLEEVEQLMHFHRKELARLDKEKVTYQRTYQRLQNRVNALAQERNRIQFRPQSQNYGEVVLQVQASSAVATDIEVSYLVSGASWQPLYDLKCEGVDKPLTLAYKAYVQQNTGVDWKDVRMTLSSSNPSLNQSRPILNPWMALVVQRPQYAQIQRTTQGNVQAFEIQQTQEKSIDVARNSAYLRVEDDLNNGPYTINTNTNSFATQENSTFVFDVKLLQNIPSDGVAHMVRIKEESIPASYEYHIVPKLDQGAFLLAKLTDYGKYKLLGGTTNIFHEGTYIGQARLNPNVAVDTLLISLGRDEEIIVQREAIPSQRKETNNHIKETVGYTIKVKNNKDASIPLVVLDHIPVSTMKELEVKLLDEGNASVKKEYGILSWRQQLGANKVVRYEYRYELKYPKDYYVQYR